MRNESELNVEEDNQVLDDDRPLPIPNSFSKPFWDAALTHQLRLQQCDDCHVFRYYPRPRCPECGTSRATWTDVSGKGTVYSFTIVRRPLTQWFRDRVPLVCAVIELDEGVRMISNVEEVNPEDVVIGMNVQVRFEDINSQISLPKFVPVN